MIVQSGYVKNLSIYIVKETLMQNIRLNLLESYLSQKYWAWNHIARPFYTPSSAPLDPYHDNDKKGSLSN